MENLIKGIKVNGTSYQIDYESIANRPFGQPTREIIIPLQENVELPLANNNPAEALFPIDIEENKEYIVTWDGTEYPCTALLDNDGGVTLEVENVFFMGIKNNSVVFVEGEAGTHSFKVERNTTSKISVDDIGPIYIEGMEPFYLKDALTQLFSTMHDNMIIETVTTTKQFSYTVVPEQTLVFNNDGGTMN